MKAGIRASHTKEQRGIRVEPLIHRSRRTPGKGNIHWYPIDRFEQESGTEANERDQRISGNKIDAARRVRSYPQMVIKCGLMFNVVHKACIQARIYCIFNEKRQRLCTLSTASNKFRAKKNIRGNNLVSMLKFHTICACMYAFLLSLLLELSSISSQILLLPKIQSNGNCTLSSYLLPCGTKRIVAYFKFESMACVWLNVRHIGFHKHDCSLHAYQMYIVGPICEWERIYFDMLRI